MDTLFDTRELDSDQDPEPNPCVVLYGPGPAGVKCKSCSLLSARGQGHSKRWYKCLLRRASYDPRRLGAASTDHRISWNACARYTTEGEVSQ